MQLPFPDGWTISECRPHGGPDIGDDGIAAAFANPIASPRLRDLAVGKKAPCIVIDDLSRPTPGDRLLPPILDELEAAGIPPEDVLILVGVANHRTLMRDDLVKKLGPMALERCIVRNHFSWARCREIGQTSRGTPIQLNEDLLGADLKILVGSIVPHPFAGFSGGAKLILPASASIESARAFHMQKPNPGDGLAVVETAARHDAEEAARLVGVDFLVNSVPTTERGIVGLVTGDLVKAHRAGVAMAQQAYATSAPGDADVCVLSAYPKDNEFLQYSTAFAPLQSAPSSLVRTGGTVVVASSSSEGQGFHSLFGPGMFVFPGKPKPRDDHDLVLFSPGVRRGDLEPEERDRAPLFATWDDTLAWLVAKHGAIARVSVFPTAVTQLVVEVVAPTPEGS